MMRRCLHMMLMGRSLMLSLSSPLSAVVTQVTQMRGKVRRAASQRAHFSSLEYCKTKSATSPALRTPVLRHQAEAQTAICAKPGAHPAHTWRTPDVRQAQKKIKSL
jgi:hypothetical protein